MIQFTQVLYKKVSRIHQLTGPLLLDSNSSRDGTNPPFQFPMWQLTNKETKSQAITKDQKNEMKGNPMEF